MTVISPNRVFSVNTLLELRVEFEDESLEAVSDDALPDKGGALVESQIQPFLEALPDKYWWHYNHDEYQDAEIIVVELDDNPTDTWETIAGIPFSDLPDECPNCGCGHLKGVKNEKADVDISTYGESKTYDIDTLLETRFSTVDCANCDLEIVEDGELTRAAIAGNQ